MKVFSDLFTEEYNTLLKQWENALVVELKLGEVSSKTTKKHLDLGNWPTLSLGAGHMQQLNGVTSWKKSAQTYYGIDKEKIEISLKDDLEGGARAFFFYNEFLSEIDWSLITNILKSFPGADEIEIYLFGKNKLASVPGLKIIDEGQMILAREAHEQGGHNVHELALLTCKLIESLDSNPTHVGVFVDSHFFKNIAKVRALRLLIQKVFNESNKVNLPQIITLNSYREWTLFERYSNMLRNNVQVASGYVAGADVVQSSGYQVLFDLETNSKDQQHNERSQRMARNTSHILNLESMLGLVDDAAYGSFHLENLSQKYAESSWKLMQILLSYSPATRADFLQGEIAKVREIRQERVKTRKDVLAGINDYPDGKERLGVTLKETKIFRVARIFEETRLKIESVSKKPKVEIILRGDAVALNNRINFIKNYFELIGLEVIDPIHSREELDNSILVLCANDEDYVELAKEVANRKFFAKFVAGKIDLPGYQMIHAGQDVYQVLSELANKLGGVK